jgi:hypothetical protein
MDDLDRLDHNELHAMLKIVKTNADFDNVTYVLALDDKMAAASIGRFYAQGGPNAGAQFLEKIIQVPIQIPPPQKLILNARISDLIYDAYKVAGVPVSNQDSVRFSQEIYGRIANWFVNLREAKRLSNALIGSLLRLNDEVNIIDMTIVEAIKFRLPDLYEYMKSHDHIFVGMDESHPRFDEFVQMPDYFVKVRQSFLKDTLPKFEQSSGIAVKATLLQLFPRLKDADRKPALSDYSDLDEWIKEQRIGSLYYYRRYFELNIPVDETPDVQIFEFLRRLGPESNDGAINEWFDKLVHNRNFHRLVRRFRSRVVEMDHVTRVKLTRLVVRQGNDLKIDSSYPEAEDFVLHVIRNSERSHRMEIATEVVRHGVPKEMVQRIVHQLKKNELTAEKNRLLSEDEERVLDRALAERMH